MNNKSILKSAALLLSSVMLLTSCVKIEMRDSSVEDDIAEAEESTQLMLSPASKKYSVESAPETESKTEEKPEVIKFTFCGDISIGEDILTDAANRATDGKSYSFLKMYTGVYNAVSLADVAVCSYYPVYNDDGKPVSTPIESVGAVYDMGVDIVNTNKSAGISEYLSEYEITELGKESEATVIEYGGMNFAYLTLGGDDSSLSYKGSEYVSEIEYAEFVSDLSVVIVNWENGTTESEMKTVSQKIAEAGADIIVGNGSELCGIEWIDTGDGTLTLAAYSLGNLLADGDSTSELCGGILEFSVCYTSENIELSGVMLTPTFIHYTAESDVAGYQVFTLDSYNDELAATHAVEGINMDTVKSFVQGKIAAEFLPQQLRS